MKWYKLIAVLLGIVVLYIILVPGPEKFAQLVTGESSAKVGVRSLRQLLNSTPVIPGSVLIDKLDGDKVVLAVSSDVYRTDLSISEVVDFYREQVDEQRWRFSGLRSFGLTQEEEKVLKFCGDSVSLIIDARVEKEGWSSYSVAVYWAKHRGSRMFCPPLKHSRN